MNVLDFVSFRYYHQMDKFHNVLRLLSNEVVHRAIALVGEDILREPLEVRASLTVHANFSPKLGFSMKFYGFFKKIILNYPFTVD